MLTSIGQMLPVSAARYGTKTALITETRELTFIEVEQLSNRLANSLVDMGISKGDRVTLFGANCWEWIVAYYGIMKTGAVVNPINSMLTPSEVQYILEDAGSRAIIASPAKAEALLELKSDTLKDIIIWGDGLPVGVTAFEDLLNKGGDGFTPVEVDGGDLGAICYTSGTTGKPKGAMQSQRSLLLNPAYTAMLQGRNSTDVMVSPLPCPHVYASVIFNANFLCGATLVMLERFTEEGMMDAVKKHRATIMDIVPTGYYYLLAHEKFDEFDFSSLTRCTVGGQTLPAAKSLEFLKRTGVPVLEMWGMTELSGGGAANPALGINKPGTIGPAYPGNSIKVVDVEDTSREVGTDEPGELMYKGPLVMMGYFNNEKATAETITPDGWMHTGDIVTRDADGYLTIVDRKKDMIITAGYNIYPVELERAMCMHSDVALAAVCGVADEAKGEIAKAFVKLRPGATVTARELVNHCREQLAAYKAPRAVQFVDEVPITSTGKIMRRMLSDIDDGTRTID